MAAVFHILNHATFKAALFMSAGIIDHEAHTRDIRRLGGLRKLMPVTFVIASAGRLSMAGIPLLNGFLSKEMMLEEATHTVLLAIALAGAGVGDIRVAVFRGLLFPPDRACVLWAGARRLSGQAA